MIVILKKGINKEEKEKVVLTLKDYGFIVKEIVGENDTVLGAVGSRHVDPREIELLPGVSSVLPISKPYKLASRELKKDDTIVKIGRVSIGGNRVCVMAGPCAIESYDQIMAIAEKVREAGAVMLRGGAFKPRTSPYSFQGLGEEGLKYLQAAGKASSDRSGISFGCGDDDLLYRYVPDRCQKYAELRTIEGCWKDRNACTSQKGNERHH